MYLLHSQFYFRFTTGLFRKHLQIMMSFKLICNQKHSKQQKRLQTEFKQWQNKVSLMNKNKIQVKIIIL